MHRVFHLSSSFQSSSSFPSFTSQSSVSSSSFFSSFVFLRNHYLFFFFVFFIFYVFVFSNSFFSLFFLYFSDLCKCPFSSFTLVSSLSPSIYLPSFFSPPPASSPSTSLSFSFHRFSSLTTPRMTNSPGFRVGSFSRMQSNFLSNFCNA